MKISHSWMKRISVTIKAHPKRVAIACIILLLCISATTYALLSKPHQRIEHNRKPTAPKQVAKYYSPLTGLEVSDKQAIAKPVTVAMIENSPDARPQSGLKEAEIVYEAIAEGGITRFMGVYQQNKPTILGPIRSLRPYYIDWSVPYNASYVHSGGSAKAIQEIRNGTYRDIGQPTNGSFYIRVTDKYAPHNVYTSFERIDALNQQKNYSESNVREFQRSDTPTSSSINATKVDIRISSPLFNSSYEYNPSLKQYQRSQAGGPHLDREQGQITSNVIICLNVDETSELQETTREVITTVGTGKATIFQNGHVIEGMWHRPSRSDQYTFTTNDGNVILLARGPTWITATPNRLGSVTWQ